MNLQKQQLLDIFNKKWSPSAFKRSNPELFQYLTEITAFLPENSTIRRRSWHVIHDCYSIPMCDNCNMNPIFFRKRTNSYTNLCIHCNKKQEQKNREINNIKKYGYASTLVVPSFKEKAKTTIKRKYGCDNLSQVEELKEARKATNIKNFGVENVSQSEEIKNKKKEKSLERYGVECVLQSEEIKEKIRNTNIEKYGVESVGKSPEIRKKRVDTLIRRYGVDNPIKLKEFKSKAQATNLEKYGTLEYQQSLIPNTSLMVLNDKHTLETLNKTKNGQEIADLLNVSHSTVLNYLNKHGIEPTNFWSSAAEREIRKIVSHIDHKFNNRRLIGKELDILLPDLNLAFEYNGIFWHSDRNVSKNMHREKYLKCKEKGIRLITIFENEWVENKELVTEKIQYLIGESSADKIFARKTDIVKISSKEKANFLNKYHIQKNGGGSLNYALMYNSEVVAVMSFIKQKKYYLLNRYATSKIVVGGFTKLLNHFEKEFNSPPIVTFADLRWSDGALYINSGFILDKELPPDYYWAKAPKIWHKSNWRHTTGLKHLENYDPAISESQNMYNHGYYKIWDCGKLRFVKNVIDKELCSC